MGHCNDWFACLYPQLNSEHRWGWEEVGPLSKKGSRVEKVDLLDWGWSKEWESLSHILISVEPEVPLRLADEYVQLIVCIIKIR